MKSVRGWLTSAAVALVLAVLARYRTVIHEASAAVTVLALVYASGVLLLAGYGWTAAGVRSARARCRRRPGRPDALVTGATPDGRPALASPAELRSALSDPPSAPNTCIGGCGRPSEPSDTAEAWDGPDGRLLPDVPRLCGQCAVRLADAARPYPPFSAQPDNRPPTPDPAFDEFAAQHQELQP